MLAKAREIGLKNTTGQILTKESCLFAVAAAPHMGDDSTTVGHVSRGQWDRPRNARWCIQTETFI